MSELVLHKGKEKSLLRRHPWLFSGAVHHISGNPDDGDIVRILSDSNQHLATGIYQKDESIICKILSFDNQPIDDHWLTQHLLSAISLRQNLGFFDTPSCNVFRLINSEGDYLPSLIADYYNGVIVLQAHSVGMHTLVPRIAALLKNILKNRCIAVFDKSSATTKGNPDDGFLLGSSSPIVDITENGRRMTIDLFNGQKTGFFIDQRENRDIVQHLSADKKVLNCFGYTGGFSIAALNGGATMVQTVDISQKAIDHCNNNISLNFGTTPRHQGIVADVLKYLNNPSVATLGFNLIVLDPPAFAKNHRSLQNGLKGYRSINQKAMEILPQGGLLMTFSCSQAVSLADFKTMVFTSAALSNRKARILRVLPHALDHPVSIYHPEGEYLKGLLLEIE